MRVAGAGGAAMLLGAWYLGVTVGWRQAALFIVGAVAGVVLYHAAFGFTSAWRVFIVDRRGAGLRAQMLMLAVTCVVFFPLLAGGQRVRAAGARLGVAARRRRWRWRVPLRHRHAARRRLRVGHALHRPAAAARACW